jgi:capsular polysaccharide biosynthesis protein
MRFYQLKNSIKDRLRPSWWMLKRRVNGIGLLFARGFFRLFPMSSFVEKEGLYPPTRFCRSTSHWMAMYGEKIGASYIPVDPTCTVSNDLPRTPHPRLRQQLVMDRDYEWPATFVVSIPNGRVWGSGYIITPDDQLLDDLSCDFRAERWSLFPKTSSVVRYWRWSKLTKIDARVAVLSTDGADIFYHWFFQLLPRFELMRRAGIDLEHIDYFVVNDLSKSFQRESIRALGIGQNKIIESSKIPYLRARELVVPSVPIGGGCYRPWMCQFLRTTFLGDDGGGKSWTAPRRLYISRGLASYRRVLNEDDVINLLRQYGFEETKLEGLSLQQQAATMASCEAIVAPHGAGLSNIVYCEPGTKLIEIFSPELVNGIYWRLASQLGLDYYYIVGEGSSATQDEDYPQSWDARADILVDLSVLRRALELSELTHLRRQTGAELPATPR